MRLTGVCLPFSSFFTMPGSKADGTRSLTRHERQNLELAATLKRQYACAARKVLAEAPVLPKDARQVILSFLIFDISKALENL